MSATFAGAAIVFERPAWLLLLLLVGPMVAAALRASLTEQPRLRAALQMIVRALVLAGVAAALAGPSVRRPARAVSVVVLADVSASVPDAGVAAARAAVDAISRGARARGDAALRIVRFAAAPDEVESAGAIARFAPPGGDATDLALATSLGAGLLDTAGVPRLLVVSDGYATRGGGIQLFALPTVRATAGDVAVLAIEAPDDVRPRVPFRVDVRLVADRAADARVRLDGDRGAAVDAPERAVSIAPGETTVSFTARVDDGGAPARLRAHVAIAGGDSHPENDDGVLALATERDPRVLCLDGAPGGAAPLAHALAGARVTVDERRAEGWTAAAATLSRYDLVVLADVPRAALGDASLAALDVFVRAGGGLLVTGGTQSFGPGGYAGSALEPLLPVRLDVPDRREEATLALALVIDKSGSMSGAKMDLTKQAARATAEALPPSDQIAVVVFDSDAASVVPLQPAANRQRIMNDIARIQSSGGTNILSGLREAVDELLPARARKKHVILLSDGQSPYDDIPDLLDAAAAAHITVSAIGVGDGADQTLLKMIATRGGGRFYHTRDPASIPRIFSRETADLGEQSVVERPTSVRAGKRVAALAGIALETAPPLGGYVVTRARALAETVLSSADGAPLLARWQLGLGQVAAWTSDLGARWAAAWARWPQYDKLWAQIARATMRRRAAAHFPIRSARSQDIVRLTIDAVGDDDRFLAGLDGQVSVTGLGPRGQPAPPRTLPLDETAPGRYEVSFRPTIDAGALLFQATLTGDREPVADASGHLTLPFAAELLPHPAAARDDGLAALTEAAALTGGRVVRDPTEVLDARDAHRQTRQPLRAAILLATLCLFVVDVAARRLRPPARDGH